MFSGVYATTPIISPFYIRNAFPFKKMDTSASKKQYFVHQEGIPETCKHDEGQFHMRVRQILFDEPDGDKNDPISTMQGLPRWLAALDGQCRTNPGASSV